QMLAERRGMRGTAARASHNHIRRLVQQPRDEWSEARRQKLLLPLYNFWSRFQFGTHIEVDRRHRMLYRPAVSRSANHFTMPAARRAENALRLGHNLTICFGEERLDGRELDAQRLCSSCHSTLAGRKIIAFSYNAFRKARHRSSWGHFQHFARAP